jgi:hypothetical protein
MHVTRMKTNPIRSSAARGRSMTPPLACNAHLDTRSVRAPDTCTPDEQTASRSMSPSIVPAHVAPPSSRINARRVARHGVQKRRQCLDMRSHPVVREK